MAIRTKYIQRSNAEYRKVRQKYNMRDIPGLAIQPGEYPIRPYWDSDKDYDTDNIDVSDSDSDDDKYSVLDIKHSENSKKSTDDFEAVVLTDEESFKGRRILIEEVQGEESESLKVPTISLDNELSEAELSFYLNDL